MKEGSAPFLHDEALFAPGVVHLAVILVTHRQVHTGAEGRRSEKGLPARQGRRREKGLLPRKA